MTPGVIFAPRVGKGRKNRPRLDNNLLTPAGPRFFPNATWRSVRTLPAQRCWFTTFPHDDLVRQLCRFPPSLNRRPTIINSIPSFRSKLFPSFLEDTSEMRCYATRNFSSIFFKILHSTSDRFFFSEREGKEDGKERGGGSFVKLVLFLLLIKASLKSLGKWLSEIYIYILSCLEIFIPCFFRSMRRSKVVKWKLNENFAKICSFKLI